MAHVIVVAPTEDGWLVQRGAIEPWTFDTAAQAEGSARRMAEALAEGGEAVEIQVYRESGDLAWRTPYAPARPIPA